MNPTPTPTLIKALRTLARDIQSGDGVANAAIAEAAERMETLVRELAEARQIIRDHDAFSLARQNERDALRAVLEDRDREIKRLKDDSIAQDIDRATLRAEAERSKAQSVRGFTYEELEVLWDKLRTDYDKARARVAELEADKARLDWIASRASTDFVHFAVGGWAITSPADGDMLSGVNIHDLRQAIDAARGKGAT